MPFSSSYRHPGELRAQPDQDVQFPAPFITCSPIPYTYTWWLNFSRWPCFLLGEIRKEKDVSRATENKWERTQSRKDWKPRAWPHNKREGDCTRAPLSEQSCPSQGVRTIWWLHFPRDPDLAVIMAKGQAPSKPRWLMINQSVCCDSTHQIERVHFVLIQRAALVTVGNNYKEMTVDSHILCTVWYVTSTSHSQRGQVDLWYTQGSWLASYALGWISW